MKESLKILVVDDDLDIIEILKYNLNNSGYFVKSAKNGIKAIKKAKKFLPDIILMDVMMPGISGIEACSEIRKIDQLRNTIIIFLSARSEDYTQISRTKEKEYSPRNTRLYFEILKKTKKITDNYIEILELYSDKYDEKISPAQFEKQD